MHRSKQATRFSLTLFAVLALFGCDSGGSDGTDESAGETAGDDSGGNLKQTGEGPCESASECEGDVCVAIVTDDPPIYCTQPCDGGCPSGFYCDTSTFALVGLDFCRVGGDEPPEEPDIPPEPPRLPCETDADCDDGQVCSLWDGERDCTVLCDVEEDCTPPPIGGFTFDLLMCATDDEGRDVCVPDPACYPNIQTCIGGLP